jgi:hypothetical protein
MISDLLQSLNLISESLNNINDPLKETLNPETRRKALGALKDIQEKIKISNSNSPTILNDLKHQELILKKNYCSAFRNRNCALGLNFKF